MYTILEKTKILSVNILTLINKSTPLQSGIGMILLIGVAFILITVLLLPRD